MTDEEVELLKADVARLRGALESVERELRKAHSRGDVLSMIGAALATKGGGA